MPLQNRVTPLGGLVAEPARGLVYGNRGCLHDANGEIRRRLPGKRGIAGRARCPGRRWVAARLRVPGWPPEPLMQPGRFTELFFLDEATAFAAGHRPCALCRREDYRAFVSLWDRMHPAQHGADAIAEQLHSERLASPTQERRLHHLPYGDLPDGAFVLHDGVAKL